MSRQAAEIWQEFQARGKITKEKRELWDAYHSAEAIPDLEDLKEVYHVDFVESFDTIYMVPTLETTVGVKNNYDIKCDMKKPMMSSPELNLEKILIIQILKMFYEGEDSARNVRDLIGRTQILNEFTNFCDQESKQFPNDSLSIEDSEYSPQFIDAIERWNSAETGEPEDANKSTRYGLLTKAINFLKKEEIITENKDAGTIHITEKAQCLVPYILSKSRQSILS